MKHPLVVPLIFLGVAGHSTTAQAQSAGTFTATGSMTAARSRHTATLLTNGKVLITGGAMGLNALATAELYDLDAGIFTRTADMTTARSCHTATLLPDGRVLIAGGGGSGQSPIPTNSAEIYDPATGTFAATANMISAHQCHQANMLANGKVLITGGSDLKGVGARQPELFDPATGTFMAPGAYANESFGFNTGQGAVSALLPDGRVLIIWEAYSAEFYDPDINSFIATGKLILQQGYNDGLPTATLLMSGKVLVAGGADDLTVGPDRVGNTDAQLYDPWTGTFTATGRMNTGHVFHTATLLTDGTVLIAGDFLYPGESVDAELYDPATGAFRPTGDMITPRGDGQTATLLNDGRVLVTGGFSPYPNATSRAEIYHAAALEPAPVLLSLPGGRQAAIQHAGTYQLVSAENPAVAGEVLIIYSKGLIDGSVIPPQVVIGGRMAQVLWFGNTPGFVGLNQINVRVPSDVASGTAIPVRLTYLSRSSNEVSVAIH